MKIIVCTFKSGEDSIALEAFSDEDDAIKYASDYIKNDKDYGDEIIPITGVNNNGDGCFVAMNTETDEQMYYIMMESVDLN